MKIRISNVYDICVNFICLVLTFVFSQTLIGIFAYSALIIYAFWMFTKYIKRTIQVSDFLTLLVIGLLLGQNFLIYVGVSLIALYALPHLKNAYKVFYEPEVIAFSMVWAVGFIASIVNSVDTKSANLYIVVYFLLLCMVIGLSLMHKYSFFDPDSSIAILSWVIFLFGLGYFMTHTISELFSTAHISVYYIDKYGVYSNTLTGIMAPFVVAGIIILLEYRKTWTRVLAGLGSLMMILVILGVQSRGTYLGILVAALWICKKKKKSKVILSVIIIIFIIAICSLFIPDEIWNSLFGRFNTSHFSDGDFSNGRSASYQIAWNMLKKHPIVGCGFWQFAEYGIQNSDPHNFVLAYLASTGLIGGISFFAFLFFSFKRINNLFIIAKDNSERIMSEISMCTLLIYVSHGLVEPSLTTSLPLSIFIIMISMTYKRKT